jgi:hypothetical protein
MNVNNSVVWLFDFKNNQHFWFFNNFRMHNHLFWFIEKNPELENHWLQLFQKHQRTASFKKKFRISPFKEQKNRSQKIVDPGYFKNRERTCGFHERPGSLPVN